MHYKKILSFLSIALLITGCSTPEQLDSENSSSGQIVNFTSNSSSSKDDSTNSSKQTNNSPNTGNSALSSSQNSQSPANGSNEDEDNSPFSKIETTELEKFTSMFNTPEYNGFLAKSFDKAENIDFSRILQNGAGIANTTISDKEKEDYMAAAKVHKIYGSLIAIKKSSLQQYIKEHTNADLQINKNFLGKSWTYVKNSDTYYYSNFSEPENKYTCMSGEKSGNTYKLRFRIDSDKHFGENADRIITLTKDGDKYYVNSNMIQWEDFCDKNQSFETNLGQNEKPCQIFTYQADTTSQKNASIVIVQDGNKVQDINTLVSKGNDSEYLTTITGMSFCDYNADGIKDFIVIGKSSFGDSLVLEQSISPDFTYEFLPEASEKIVDSIKAEKTISAVKAVLLGDKTSFYDYKEAYSQVIKLSDMSSNENTKLQYNLIYIDNDDIPELVVDVVGYGMSIYSYKNNRIQCLMYQWGYGAGGNYGYMYAPQKGVLFNHNTDYAGAIQYDSYMTCPNQGELSCDFSVESIMFKDADGDGEPSEEELNNSSEIELYKEYFYNYTDKEMTDDEIKNQVKEYEKLKFEEISGTLSSKQVLEKLK
ncbi:hypothetical protein [Butyrivibrio sp. NC3005]|uniref:hypothetical protein n=1 Tax=Butyrivibrio sp. NC3005 TaxID=1280685 RepID=UPI00040B1AD3|nr:hypothetical protein [Butyrivibrio sp. NC3005]